MAPSIAPSNLERRAALPSRSSAEAQKLELCYAQARENQQSHFDCLEDSLYLSYRRRIPSICKLLGYGSSCTCLANYGFCANDSEMNRLKGVIGLTMFKYKPAEKPNESHESHESTEYTEDELESINAVYKKIVGFQKEKNDVLMTFVFVSLMVKEEDGFGLVDIPVFRIPKPNDPSGTYFVDCTGRVYKSWNDFLCNNVLPAGRVCYPKEGVYSGNSDGQVIVDFGLTPAAKVSAKVLKVTDITTSVAGIAAGVASLFPPVAAAGAVAVAATVAATSVYGIVRGSVQLADRGKHGQKLNDKEAFNHWLSIAGCALGIGSSAATNTVKLMAQRGQGTSKLLFKAFDGINAAAVTVNGACVVKDGVEIIQKKDRNALDYMQFAMSLALLLHSFKNIKKSERLYCDTQDQILKGCRKNFTSKNQIKKLNKVISKALASDPNKMVGQAKAIRNLKLNKNLILPPSTNSYFNNATRSTSGSTSDSQPQKLHVILSNMKRAMQEIGPCNSEMLLNILSTVVTRSVWGEKILRILRIVLQCRTNVLQNYEEMTKVAMEFIDFFLDIWRNDDDDDGEENVAEVLCGTVFSEFAATEQVFHFPSDHRSWGDKGILQSEEYLKIAQKILDVPDLQSSVLINYDEGAAHVSCGDVGAVTITSSVKESTIVVEKFDSDSIKHVIKNFPRRISVLN